jgi:hypothetical protein
VARRDDPLVLGSTGFPDAAWETALLSLAVVVEDDVALGGRDALALVREPALEGRSIAADWAFEIGVWSVSGVTAGSLFADAVSGTALRFG